MERLPRSNYDDRAMRKLERKPERVIVRHAYRPVGFLLVVSTLVFVVLLDHGVSLPIAALVTILVSLLTVMFS